MTVSSQARDNSTKGLLYALAGTAFGSTSFVTAKYGLRAFSPAAFSLLWMAGAAACTLVIILATGRGHQLALPARVVRRIVPMGLMAGIGVILLWAGLARLDPTFVSFLNRLTPVITVVLSALLLGERLMTKELMPASLMVIGGCVGAIGRWSVVGTGLVLTLLGFLFFSVQTVIAKTVVTEVHPSGLLFYRVAIAAAAIAVWLLITGEGGFDAAPSHWLVTGLGSLLGPCLSLILAFQSYRYWDLSRSAIVTTVEPLFVLPLGYLFHSQLPSPKELLGGCVILVGAFWFWRIHHSRAHRE